jgi:hypothetical protein
MSIYIVIGLEVIEVKQEYGEYIAIARMPGNFLFEPFFEVTSIK